MKIAIITFQDAINYGAALQAFALKTVVDKYADCKVLNIYNSYFHRSQKINGLKEIVLHLINKKNIGIREARFNNFKNNFIVDNEPYLEAECLVELNNEFDLFITGSDQVWNLECSGNNTAYFLDFVEDDKKKGSYAASFGGDKIREEKRIVDLLKGFRYISVRENNGKELLNNLVNLKVTKVLDPTLLVPKEDWKTNFNLKFEKKYVLVYEVLNGDKLLNEAKKIAALKGLPIMYITSSNKPQCGVKTIKNAGPIEWLQLFAGCDCVFTNSFHGVAFSLLFEKQFWVELLPPPASTNVRLLDILSLMNLNDRIITQNKDFSNYEEISYLDINRVLESERNVSIEYIENMINGIE